MFLLNDEYETRKVICDKLFDRYNTQDFKWTNQSYTSMAASIFKQRNGYRTESSHNGNTRNMLDEFYPIALQWCTPDDIPEDVVNIDICKSYPNILLNNTQTIPIYTIHDVIEPFNCTSDLNLCGEFYINETVLNKYGTPLILEAGFCSGNLISHLVDNLNMSLKQIKYKIVTKKALKPDTFKPPMEFIFNNFEEGEAKKLANSFIGELGRKYNTTSQGFTCTEYDTAMCCWTAAMAAKRNVTIYYYNELFLIREQEIERLKTDNTSVNRFVVSEAILKCLQLLDACFGKDSKLYSYNTDGIFITNPKIRFKKGKGCIYIGQAGSGKTTKLCQMVMEAKNPLVLSFTNKAIENVKSKLIRLGMDKNVVNNICRTFDSYFCEWSDVSYHPESLKNKTLFIEEFSMVPNKWITKIYNAYSEFGNKVYMFGDPNQCEPVESGSVINYNYLESAVINELCGNIEKLEYIEKTC